MKANSNTLQYKIKFPGSYTCRSERMKTVRVRRDAIAFYFDLLDFLRIIL